MRSRSEYRHRPTLEKGSYGILSAQFSESCDLTTHLGETSIEDSIRYLVGNLVWVSFPNGLRGEEEAITKSAAVRYADAMPVNPFDH